MRMGMATCGPIWWACALAAFVAGAACSPALVVNRTPSGVLCDDLPVISAGQDPARAFHRLGPIRTEVKPHTEAERLAALRKAACALGADAVVEAVNEEIAGEKGASPAGYVLVSSGTAVVWTAAQAPGTGSPY